MTDAARRDWFQRAQAWRRAIAAAPTDPDLLAQAAWLEAEAAELGITAKHIDERPWIRRGTQAPTPAP